LLDDALDELADLLLRQVLTSLKDAPGLLRFALWTLLLHLERETRSRAGD
jgi:hypothetical protein